MKYLLFFFILLFANISNAVNVQLAWESNDAIYYKVALSIDGGKRWNTTRIANENSFTWIMCPEDKLVLFKVAACEENKCIWNNTEGAWYDHRLKTSETGFPIITTQSDKTIIWEAKDGALGYQLYFSSDGGNTYPTNDIINGLEYNYLSADGVTIVFSYGCAIYESETICRRWAGTWYKVDPSNEYGRHIFWQYRIKSFYSN
jgi:hypothetical protein